MNLIRRSSVIGMLFTVLLWTNTVRAAEEADGGRWSAARVWGWYSAQPWLVGFNYIPATAINTTEMWQAGTFDPVTIDAEMALAQRTGFNCARVFLQYLVWEADPEGMKRRMAEFLGIAQKHGIRTLFVLFDDCNFSPFPDPFLGKQPDPIPGKYAHAWTPSPGPKRAHDRAAWPKLEAYVCDVVREFARDERVLAWETWNEPLEDRAPLGLVEASFVWARQAKPSQPVAATVYGSDKLQGLVNRLSDFVSFHNYSPALELEQEIQRHLGSGRPVLCTEWLFRPYDSVPATCLPVFARYGVGAFQWGLVNGKTQTHLHMRPTGKPAELWQHDLFRGDHTPYEEKEFTLIKEAIHRGVSQPAAGQWSVSQAWAWFARQPWLVGCNFLPSTAVNDIEMWRNETFDAKTIDRELGWARALGFNTVRVFLNFVVWEAEPEKFKVNFRRFLKIANKHELQVLPILFDDCNFAGRVASAEPQPAPVPGLHNSQWVSSPPLALVTNHTAWPRLERYVRDVVSTFGKDRGVVAWDLYNEPGNSGMGEQSLALAEATFAWARGERPVQPLTMGAWADFGSRFSRRMMELSDVISFHSYDGLDGLSAKHQACAAYGRPILCTEWMARTLGSRFETHLPYLKDNRIGGWNWGLVAGRTQTYYPWGSPKDAPEPKLWFHDLLRKDGTPHDASEARFIGKVISEKPIGSVVPMKRGEVLVPTALEAPVSWRYTLEKPAENWFTGRFDDSNWEQGPAPFGREEISIARRPRTIWTNSDIWLRREFALPLANKRDLSLLLHHDEDTEVYINGKLAAKVAGYNASYMPVAITREALDALRPGPNTMAVHCRQTTGGQFLDVGIEASATEPAASAWAEDSRYRGWEGLALRNGLIELQVVPSIGGRIAQFSLGNKEFLWVNRDLEGKSSTTTGLARDGGWLNYGGDKLWPAPQGWDNDQQWPGPPDAVLDGQPYRLDRLGAKHGQVAIRLTSGKDLRSGIQFSRVVRLFPGSTRVSFEATMRNIDVKPRRWGIWSHTQLEGELDDQGTHNSLLKAWCPLNTASRFPNGYSVIFGAPDNPSFQPDANRQLMRVQYLYRVGKIGLDSPAGWVATVDGQSGAVFVQRFEYEPEKEYPEGSSVEFWMNGQGSFRAWGKENVMSEDPAMNPFVFESEMLSPLSSLKPGKRCTWRYDWYACNVGGDFPVVACSEVGVTSEPLVAELSGQDLRVRGRFGVFSPGKLVVVLLDGRGRQLETVEVQSEVSPLRPVVLENRVRVTTQVSEVRLQLEGKNKEGTRELASAKVQVR